MNTNYTDTQLKQALAKMLPEYCCWSDGRIALIEIKEPHLAVLDTELLHLCWLVEESLDERQQREYQIHIYCLTDENWTYEELVSMFFELSWVSTWDLSHASWQQRVWALCKVKDIVIS